MMKNIKTFELYIDGYNKHLYEDELKNYKFKVGDYIKWSNKKHPYLVNNNYYKVIEINTRNDEKPYLICNLKTDVEYWTLGNNYEFVPEYEVTAIKYNL